MVASDEGRRITQMGDFALPVVDFFGGETVHQGHGGHALGWKHPPSRQLAHPGEETLPIGVRVLLEGDDPQPGSGEGRYNLPEPPAKEMTMMRILEVRRSFDEPGRRQSIPGRAHVVIDAFLKEPWFTAGGIGVSVVPV